MGWLAVLGSVAVVLIAGGLWLASLRIRRYRQEREARIARTFAEMAGIAKDKHVERRADNIEHEKQSGE